MRRAFTYVCMILAGALPLSAQVLPFHAYTTRNGLPSNHITALRQDDGNRLWVGTDNGLAVFDGRFWKVATMADGLPSNIINDIEPSLLHPGVVWVGTLGGGVARCENGRWNTVIPGIDEEDRVVLSIAECEDGRLFVVTVRDLKVLDGDSVRWIRPLKAGTDGAVVHAVPGGVALAIRDSVIFFRGSSVTGIRLPGGPATVLTSLAVSPSGDLWIGSRDSTLFRLRDTVLLWHGSLPDRPFSTAFGADGSVWVSGDYSVMKLHSSLAGAVVRYAAANGLPKLISGEGYVDREDNYWLATWQDGLFKLSSEGFVTLPLGGQVGSVVPGPGLRFWAGLDDGVTEVAPGGRGVWTLYRHSVAEMQCGRGPTPTLIDNEGMLWVLSSEGRSLARYEIPSRPGGTLRRVLAADIGGRFPGTYALAMAQDRREHLWISLPGAGVARVDPGTLRIRQFMPRRGQFLRDIRVFSEDRKGRMWLGDFTDGLSVFVPQGDTFRYARTYTATDGLPHNAVRSISESADGMLWIGTRLGGVARFDGEHFVSVSQREGLRSNAGWGITVDRTHRVWAGTDLGVEGIDGRTMKPLNPIREIPGEKIVRLGIIGDTLLWAQGASELYLYDFQAERPNPVAPPIAITAFLVNGMHRQPVAGQSFAYDENTMVIEYAGVSLRDDAEVTYQYRLTKDGGPWQEAGTQRSVTLAALSPGTYAFVVRARNGDGVFSRLPAALVFTIESPFWRRWWFLAGSILAVLLSSVMLVRRRIRALEGARRLQEDFSRRLIHSQEEERKRIAAELHDGLGQNLLVIKNKIDLLRTREMPPGTLVPLQEIADVATRSVAEAREIAYNLRPYLLDRLGLTKGLRAMVRRLADATDIRFTAEIAEIDGLYPPDAEISIYRIVQEALNNVVKHSRATEATVTVRREGKRLVIVVADNGRGGAHAQQSEAGGFGLAGIGERVRILGGTWSIVPNTPTGTRLEVIL